MTWMLLSSTPFYASSREAWRDNEKIFESSFEPTNPNYYVWTNLAVAKNQKGDEATALQIASMYVKSNPQSFPLCSLWHIIEKNPKSTSVDLLISAQGRSKFPNCLPITE
jgi:hypothetical protein